MKICGSLIEGNLYKGMPRSYIFKRWIFAGCWSNEFFTSKKWQYWSSSLSPTKNKMVDCRLGSSKNQFNRTLIAIQFKGDEMDGLNKIIVTIHKTVFNQRANNSNKISLWYFPYLITYLRMHLVEQWMLPMSHFSLVGKFVLCNRKHMSCV